MKIAGDLKEMNLEKENQIKDDDIQLDVVDIAQDEVKKSGDLKGTDLEKKD